MALPKVEMNIQALTQIFPASGMETFIQDFNTFCTTSLPRNSTLRQQLATAILETTTKATALAPSGWYSKNNLIPQLPSEWERKVTDALMANKIAHAERLAPERSLKTLRPCEWIDDDLITGYSKLLFAKTGARIKSPIMFSDLEALLELYPMIDFNYIDTHGQVFIPFCVGGHWSFVMLTSDRTGTTSPMIHAEHYDSLFSLSSSRVDPFKFWFENRFLSEVRSLVEGQSPKQQNSYDCGLFVLMGIRLLSMGSEHLSQPESDEIMPNFRNRVLAELLAGVIDPTLHDYETFVELDEEAEKHPIVPEVVVISGGGIKGDPICIHTPPPQHNYVPTEMQVEQLQSKNAGTGSWPDDSQGQHLNTPPPSKALLSPPLTNHSTAHNDSLIEHLIGKPLDIASLFLPEDEATSLLGKKSLSGHPYSPELVSNDQIEAMDMEMVLDSPGTHLYTMQLALEDQNETISSDPALEESPKSFLAFPQFVSEDQNESPSELVLAQAQALNGFLVSSQVVSEDQFETTNSDNASPMHDSHMDTNPPSPDTESLPLASEHSSDDPSLSDFNQSKRQEMDDLVAAFANPDFLVTGLQTAVRIYRSTQQSPKGEPSLASLWATLGSEETPQYSFSQRHTREMFSRRFFAEQKKLRRKKSKRATKGEIAGICAVLGCEGSSKVYKLAQSQASRSSIWTHLVDCVSTTLDMDQIGAYVALYGCPISTALMEQLIVSDRDMFVDGIRERLLDNSDPLRQNLTEASKLHRAMAIGSLPDFKIPIEGKAILKYMSFSNAVSLEEAPSRVALPS